MKGKGKVNWFGEKQSEQSLPGWGGGAADRLMGQGRMGVMGKGSELLAGLPPPMPTTWKTQQYGPGRDELAVLQLAGALQTVSEIAPLLIMPR